MGCQTFFDTGLLPKMIIEITLALIHPNAIFVGKEWTTDKTWNLYPIPYYVNDFLVIIQLLRVYTYIFVIITISKFYSSRADRICKMMSVDLSFSLAIKYFYKSHPNIFLLTFFIVTSFPMALMLQIIEDPPLLYLNKIRGYEHTAYPYNSYSNCLWNVMVIITTVGYGDYYPESILGRLLTLFISLIGIIMVSTSITTLQGQVGFDEHQKEAKIFIDRINYKNIIKDSSTDYFHKTLTFLYAKNDFIKTCEMNRSEIDFLLKREFEQKYKDEIKDNRNFNHELDSLNTLIITENDFYQRIIRENQDLMNDDIIKRILNLEKSEMFKRKKLINLYQKKLVERQSFKNHLRFFNREFRNTIDENKTTFNLINDLNTRLISYKKKNLKLKNALNQILYEMERR